VGFGVVLVKERERAQHGRAVRAVLPERGVHVRQQLIAQLNKVPHQARERLAEAPRLLVAVVAAAVSAEEGVEGP
nr:hypothetical protein [Tanacetum cinerariifolium]